MKENEKYKRKMTIRMKFTRRGSGDNFINCISLTWKNKESVSREIILGGGEGWILIKRNEIFIVGQV